MRPGDAIGLWCLAFAASTIVGTHGLVYWDAGDYVRLAIDGGPSGLLLGRPLFLLVSRLILASGIEPASAEPVLRWFWAMVGATAAPAMAWLAVRLGLDRAPALVAGAALALSPSFAHVSHQVLTDAPALVLSIVALVAAASSRAIAAGLLLAAAITTRETAVVHAVAIALLLGRRAVVALSIAAATIAAIVWILPPPALIGWFQAMSRSTASAPLSLWQVVAPVVWLLAAGPLPVIIGIVMLTRRVPGRWRLASAPAAIATLVLLFYPDGSFSPRYVLATAPIAFFPAAAAWMVARPRLAALALLVPLALVPIAAMPSRAVAARGAAVMQRIASLPAGTLLVPGHYCSYARLGATILKRRDLDLVCPGWEWPADPARVLDEALAAGRPIALDLADDAWMPPREAANRDAVRAWAAGRAARNLAGFTVITK